jgi:hypothetical protein
VARVEPLFYAVDVNEDGLWDLIYKDVFEDGVNGDEVFYESPSGMFTSSIANFCATEFHLMEGLCLRQETFDSSDFI